MKRQVKSQAKQQTEILRIKSNLTTVSSACFLKTDCPIDLDFSSQILGSYIFMRI